VLRPDKDANVAFYSRAVTARDVLSGKMATADVAARDFASALGRDVTATTGRR